MRRLYARYRNDGPGVTMDRKGGSAFYAPILLDAFEKDAAAGDGVTIDWDPLCGCQDFDGLRVGRVTITQRQADKVKAHVAFVNLKSPQAVVLTLTPTAAGWRVADVADKNDKSVMTLLQNAAAHAARSKAAQPVPSGPKPPS